MSVVLLHASVFLAALSVFFDNNILQLLGFGVVFLFVLSRTKHWTLAIIAVLFAVLVFLLDSSAMGSKTVVLIYLFYQTKNLDPDFLSILIKRAHTNFFFYLFMLSLPVTCHQMFSGVGATGAFGLIRGSAYFWDPNYFVIFLICLINIYRLRDWFFWLYALLGQTLTSAVAYFFWRNAPFFNFLSLMLVISMYIYFFQYDFSELLDYIWISERIYSFSLRAEMLSAYVQGDALQGAAPHMSFLSGFKKNPVSTMIFFLSLPFLSRDRSTLLMFLLISMTYDVFFGPLCFLIPIAINGSCTSLKSR